MLYGFKELMVLPVEDGEDEFIKYRRMKYRKTESTDWVCGNCNCEPCICDGDVNINEALTPVQRRQSKMRFKKYKSRIEIGRKRAERKIASPEKLKKRARKAARIAIIAKITIENLKSTRIFGIFF